MRRHSSELASISPNPREVVLFPGKCNRHVNELRIQTCKMFQAGLLILSKVTTIRGKKTPGRHTKMSLPRHTGSHVTQVATEYENEAEKQLFTQKGRAIESLLVHSSSTSGGYLTSWSYCLVTAPAQNF